MNIVVKLHQPTLPYAHLATARVGDLSYGFQIGRSSTIGFVVPRDTPIQPHLWQTGTLIQVVRDDGNLPWTGFITAREPALGDPGVEITAEEVGGALLSDVPTPTQWGERELSVSFLVQLALSYGEAIAEPPPLVELQGDSFAGPPMEYQFKGESLLKMLERIRDTVGWEWRIEGQLDGPNQKLALFIEERIGRDQRYETIFTERYHFVEAGLDEDAKSALTRAVVHGGITTPYSTRPVAVSSQDDKGGGPDFTVNVSSTPHTFAPLSQSPLAARTKTMVLKTSRRQATLAAAARQMHEQTDIGVAETISIELLESAIDMSTIELGSVYGVRFDDLLLGLGVERAFRATGIGLGTEGVVELTGPVQYEQPDEVIANAA